MGAPSLALDNTGVDLTGSFSFGGGAPPSGTVSASSVVGCPGCVQQGGALAGANVSLLLLLIAAVVIFAR